jgi:hypothetical protein
VVKQRVKRTMKKDLARYSLTKEMVQKKLSLDEMAQQQNHIKGTIIRHLGILKNANLNLDFSYLEPDDETCKEVIKAFEECGERGLGEIYRFLGEKIPYDIIRLVIALKID